MCSLQYRSLGFLDIIPQNVRALSRPHQCPRVDNPAYTKLETRGVQVSSVDLKGPEHRFVKALTNVNVVISAIAFTDLNSQIPPANAAKAAKVKLSSISDDGCHSSRRCRLT